MLRLVFTAFLLAACSPPAPLFDDVSLQGWEPIGAASWTVENAEIVGAGRGDGFLTTLAQYGNFELSLEFQVDAATNSGVFIRCRERARIHPETCYELNIWDEHPNPQARTGSIVLRVMPPLRHVNTLGRWNTLLVLARDRRLEVRINGELTAVLDDAETAVGFIALQRWQSGTVRFRKLRLREF